VRAEVTVVTTKGQLVVPSRLRRKYGLRRGTRVAFVEEGKKLVLQPLTPEYVRAQRGSLAGKPSALEIVLEDRRRERDL